MLTSRLSDAFALAVELHVAQRRKASDIPYLAHLLAVTALVLEDGGDEDDAIAALLHDAVEDQGGLATLERIRQQFGDTVAHTVEACSDTMVSPKSPWHDRKRAYIAHLASADARARRISAADKLHNARSILDDYRRLGDGLWSRFNAPRDDVLWYYRAVADELAKRQRSPLVEELCRTVDELERAICEKA